MSSQRDEIADLLSRSLDDCHVSSSSLAQMVALPLVSTNSQSIVLPNCRTDNSLESLPSLGNDDFLSWLETFRCSRPIVADTAAQSADDDMLPKTPTAPPQFDDGDDDRSGDKEVLAVLGSVHSPNRNSTLLNLILDAADQSVPDGLPPAIPSTN